MKLALSLTLTLALSGLLALPATAQNDASLSGEQIASRILRSSAFDWDGAKTRLKMVLTSRDGVSKVRVMDVLSRKKAGLGQTKARFHSPPDVAGTAFLILEQKDGASEQHIYIPSLRRTRRIGGGEREGSFMSSDFSYADMRRVDAGLSTHKRLADEKIGQDATFVVESTPKPEAKVPYTKLQVWVRKSDNIPLRTRFYDAKGVLLKTLHTLRVGKLHGRPAMLESLMKNEKTGHSTLLVVESMQPRNKLPDSAFTPTALQHPF